MNNDLKKKFLDILKYCIPSVMYSMMHSARYI